MNTTQSLQQQISEALLSNFPSATIKKIDRDNYLDIHLPEINEKKGTHLFFNTSKNKIKFGFYCRDEEFVENALSKSTNLEKYAHGVRLAGNPEFDDVESAVQSATTFLEMLKGEKVEISEAEDQDVNEDVYEDEDDNRGYPVISWSSPIKLDREILTKYSSKWQCKSVVYNWRAGISGFLPEFYEQFTTDEICPSFTKQELEQISKIIRTEKIIPCLDYAPSELFFHTKIVWWIVPFCIWKDDTASFVFVDKNGFAAIYKDSNGEIEINHIFPWESVTDLEFETMYDDDSNVNRLTLYQKNGYLSFDEFVSEGEDGDRGSYLSVIESIWLARKETIEASSGQSVWYEGVGGEGFKSFEKPSDLLDKAKWEDPNRPDPSWYGYTKQSKLEQAESCIEDEEYDEAIELLTDYLTEIDSESDRENYIKAKDLFGDCLRNKGQHPEAIQVYLEVIELDPTHKWARRSIASCYMSIKNYEEAIQWYNQVIEHDDNYHSRYMLGWVFLWIKEEYNICLDHLNRSIELKSDYPQSFDLRGILYDKLGDQQKSLESFDRCVELKPNNLDYVWKRGKSNHKLSNYSASNGDLLKVIGSEPYSGYAYTHFEISVNYYELNELSEALKYINEAIELDSTGISYLNHKGKVHEALGEFESAENSYKKAISINDRWDQPYYRLGLLYKKLGRLGEAVENFKKAHDIYDTWVWPVINLGRCCTLLGSNDEAIQWFEKALEMKKDVDWVRYDRGLAYHNAGLFEKAIEDYTSAKEYESSNLGWYYNLESANRQQSVFLGDEKELLVSGTKEILVQALIFRGKKLGYHKDGSYNYDRCFSDLTKAIELDPTNYVAFYERGVKHSETDWESDYKEKAIQDFKSCLSIYEYAPAYRALGMISNDSHESIEYLKKAIDLDSKDSESWKALGRAYFSLKNYEEALNAFTQSYHLNPSESICNQLGKTYFELKQYENALSYFEKTIEFDSTYGTYYYFAARCSKELNKTEEAFRHIQDAIKHFSSSREDYIKYYTFYKELATINNVSESHISSLQNIVDYHSAVVNAENYNSVPDSELEISFLKNYVKSLDDKYTSSIFSEVLNEYEFDWSTYTWFKDKANYFVKRHLLQNQHLSGRFSSEDVESMKSAIEQGEKDKDSWIKIQIWGKGSEIVQGFISSEEYENVQDFKKWNNLSDDTSAWLTYLSEKSENTGDSVKGDYWEYNDVTHFTGINLDDLKIEVSNHKGESIFNNSLDEWRVQDDESEMEANLINLSKDYGKYLSEKVDSCLVTYQSFEKFAYEATIKGTSIFDPFKLTLYTVSTDEVGYTSDFGDFCIHFGYDDEIFEEVDKSSMGGNCEVTFEK